MTTRFVIHLKQLPDKCCPLAVEPEWTVRKLKRKIAKIGMSEYDCDFHSNAHAFVCTEARQQVLILNGDRWLRDDYSTLDEYEIKAGCEIIVKSMYAIYVKAPYQQVRKVIVPLVDVFSDRPTATVGQLKTAIHRYCNFPTPPPKEQHLRFEGTLLSDDAKTFDQLGIKSRDLVYLQL